MRKLYLFALGMVVGFLISGLAVVSTASAQDSSTYLPDDLIPTLQHSVFIPTGVVQKGSDGLYHFSAFTGAGYQMGINFIDSNGVIWLGLGMPFVVQLNSELDQFRYTMGLNATFAGNFGLGVGYDIVDTATQTGLGLGDSSWSDNGVLYFSFHLPLNGGGLINVWKN